MHRQHRRPLLSPVLLCAALGLLAWRPAQAVLQIDITQGVTDPIAVAVVPFARAVPADGGFDVAAVVQRDLEGSGRFRAMARARHALAAGAGGGRAGCELARRAVTTTSWSGA